METEAKLINENYDKNLKAGEYVDFLEEMYNEEPESLRIPLEFIYNVVKSGRFKGSKLLDIGSGNVVHNIASASAFYQNIVMSDYVVDMCEELKRWLKGQSKSKQFLDYPAELEGYGGNLEAGKRMLENRIRKCVKQVVRCDILNNNIFLEELKPGLTPPYDLITAIWCLDAVAPDLDSFITVLKRINKFLRPGGGLILMGDFDEENWKIGEKEFHNLQTNEADLRKAMKESGFGIIDMKICYKKCDNETEDSRYDYYCIEAEKL